MVIVDTTYKACIIPATAWINGDLCIHSSINLPLNLLWTLSMSMVIVVLWGSTHLLEFGIASGAVRFFYKFVSFGDSLQIVYSILKMVFWFIYYVYSECNSNLPGIVRLLSPWILGTPSAHYIIQHTVLFLLLYVSSNLGERHYEALRLILGIWMRMSAPLESLWDGSTILGFGLNHHNVEGRTIYKTQHEVTLVFKETLLNGDLWLIWLMRQHQGCSMEACTIRILGGSLIMSPGFRMLV